MTLEIHQIKEAEKWQAVLDDFPAKRKNIYLFPDYYRTWLKWEQSEAACLVFKHDDITIIYPFLMKEIKGYDLTDTYYDLETAYGYGGPVSNTEELPDEIIRIFNQEVDQWCAENNIVAEFIRVDTCFDNKIRFADYSPVRKNVHVNMDMDFKFNSKARYEHRRGIKQEMYVEFDDALDTMDEFENLYRQTAIRLKMKPFYHFDHTYFDEVKEHLINNSFLVNVKYRERTLASSLIFYTNHFASSHLAASVDYCPTFRRNDFLFYSFIEELIRRGIKDINLGGGTGYDCDDLLFRFKKKYGNEIRETVVGKKVNNRLVYEQVNKTWEKQHPDRIAEYGNYFLRHLYV